MKQFCQILSVIFIIISCGDNNSYLTENEKYQNLENGLGQFLDSEGQSTLIYDHFIPYDTISLIKILATKQAPSIIFGDGSLNFDIADKWNKIKTENLTDLNFIDRSKSDSIIKNFDNPESEYSVVYGISEPFKPDTK